MYSINISSALIIGLIFGKFFEAAVFIVAYCSLRSFAGGYHAKTPLRCYVFSVIMLIIVLVGINPEKPSKDSEAEDLVRMLYNCDDRSMKIIRATVKAALESQTEKQ